MANAESSPAMILQAITAIGESIFAPAPVEVLATSLTSGQLAIIQYNTDDADDPHIAGTQPMQRDSISFVLLAPVDASTTIFFTDRAWNSGTSTFAAAGSGDSTYTWASGSARTAGTVITVSEAELQAAGIEFADTGETIYAYQGTINAPSPFLYAVDVGDENNTFEVAKLTGLLLLASPSEISTTTAIRMWQLPTETTTRSQSA